MKILGVSTLSGTSMKVAECVVSFLVFYATRRAHFQFFAHHEFLLQVQFLKAGTHEKKRMDDIAATTGGQLDHTLRKAKTLFVSY